MNKALIDLLAHLTTPHLADACLRTKVPARSAPANLCPLSPGMRCAGRARPVRHVGSIDVFLEAFEEAVEGDVLVVDNEGRLDEACVGDLITLEAKAAGIAGIVIWGLHRDSREIRKIGLPFFSLGALPTGPQRLDARPADVFDRAMVDTHAVTPGDFVVADADGVLFLPEARVEGVTRAAVVVRDAEERHIKAMHAGRSFRSQVEFSEYLSRRNRNPTYGFREHLKNVEGAGEA